MKAVCKRSEEERFWRTIAYSITAKKYNFVSFQMWGCSGFIAGDGGWATVAHSLVLLCSRRKFRKMFSFSRSINKKQNWLPPRQASFLGGLAMAVFTLKTHYPSGRTWANICSTSSYASSYASHYQTNYKCLPRFVQTDNASLV